MREAARLPGELETEAAQLVSQMDAALSGIDEAMNRWVWLSTLAGHMRQVQMGQEPQKINTTGDDPALSSAVAKARQAIRLRCQGASIDDKIAAGVIFNVPVVAPPQSPMDDSQPGVYTYEVPSR